MTSSEGGNNVAPTGGRVALIGGRVGLAGDEANVSFLAHNKGGIETAMTITMAKWDDIVDVAFILNFTDLVLFLKE